MSSNSLSTVAKAYLKTGYLPKPKAGHGYKGPRKSLRLRGTAPDKYALAKVAHLNYIQRTFGGGAATYRVPAPVRQNVSSRDYVRRPDGVLVRADDPSVANVQWKTVTELQCDSNGDVSDVTKA